MIFEMGLIAPYAIQPGVQVGLVQPLGDRVFIRPQLGAFTRPGRHASGLVDVEVGLQGPRLGASVGLAYVAEYRLAGETIGLDGSRSTNRELHHHVVPTLNGDLAWVRSGPDPFVRLSVGRKMPVADQGALWLGLELGLRFGDPS